MRALDSERRTFCGLLDKSEKSGLENTTSIVQVDATLDGTSGGILLGNAIWQSGSVGANDSDVDDTGPGGMN